MTGSGVTFAGGCGEADSTAHRAGRHAGLWVLDAGGTNLRRMRDTGVTVSYAWSPDGTQIASVAKTGSHGPAPLIITDVDGPGERVVLDAAVSDSERHGVLHLAWSPDGTRLSYSVMRFDSPRQLVDVYTVNADGSAHTKVSGGLYMGDPAASPDGTRLAYTGQDGQLYVMNFDGTRTLRLTDPPSRNLDPAWSPDSGRIAFESHPGDTVRSGYGRLEVVNADGTGHRVVTAQKNRFFSEPAWSADGRWIAFDNWPHEDWGWVTLVRPDGSGPHTITPELGPPTEHLSAWSPDSAHLAFVEGDGITISDPDGSHRRCVTTQGRNSAPAWSPDGTKLAFIRS